MAEVPTATEIRAWSKVDLDSLGYDTDPDLQRLIDRAAANFTQITGVAAADVETADTTLYEQAIQGLTEQQAFQTSMEYAETLSDWDLIQSFSAGPYTETRRSPEDMLKARMVNPWPWLNDILWGFMTPEKEDEWIAFFSGENAPAESITEVDWSTGQRRGYGVLPVDDPFIWGA